MLNFVQSQDLPLFIQTQETYNIIVKIVVARATLCHNLAMLLVVELEAHIQGVEGGGSLASHTLQSPRLKGVACETRVGAEGG